jgi:hypothetical protein
MLLNAVQIQTEGELSESQKAGISAVTGLIGERRVQIGKEGKLLVGSFNPQTGDVLPELPDDTKDKIRDVARLLKVEAMRIDPTTKKSVKV